MTQHQESSFVSHHREVDKAICSLPSRPWMELRANQRSPLKGLMDRNAYGISLQPT